MTLWHLLIWAGPIGAVSAALSISYHHPAGVLGWVVGASVGIVLAYATFRVNRAAGLYMDERLAHPDRTGTEWRLRLIYLLTALWIPAAAVLASSATHTLRALIGLGH